MDSISCKECKKCLFINTLQLIIQSSTKYNIWQKVKIKHCFKRCRKSAHITLRSMCNGICQTRKKDANGTNCANVICNLKARTEQTKQKNSARTIGSFVMMLRKQLKYT